MRLHRASPKKDDSRLLDCHGSFSPFPPFSKPRKIRFSLIATTKKVMVFRVAITVDGSIKGHHFTSAVASGAERHTFQSSSSCCLSQTYPV